MIHKAMMPCLPSHSPCPEGHHRMVSLDGESWLEVEPRFPCDSEREEIARMFGVQVHGKVRTMPMTFARRYLAMRGARFIE